MLSTEITTWVLVAGAAEAKIYEKDKHAHVLTLNKDFVHAEGRALVHDLVTDHPGHYAAGSSSGSYIQRHNPKDNENASFALEICQFLDHARAIAQFDELIIVCLPHFYGLLEKHLGEVLKKKVTQHILKNYVKLSARELSAKIFPMEA